MLRYHEVPPPASLAPFVRCFWTLRGAGAAPPERILPDGSLELVFHLGDPFRQDGEPQPGAMVIGRLDVPTIVQPGRRTDVFGIRFHAGGAAPFFRLPISELRDSIVPAGDLLAGAAAFLEPSTTVARIESATQLLLRRLTPGPRTRAVSAAVWSLRRSNGDVRIRALASDLGMSERTLERHFEAGVGLLPKTFARLMRFQAYVADPSRDAGYSDDSHLTRDFHQFAGITPARFAAEQHALCDSFVGNVQAATAGD